MIFWYFSKKYDHETHLSVWKIYMKINTTFSENPRINTLIENILDELCPFLEEQATEISELTAIGKALGTGEDITVLLEMILSIARRFTKADGGTLYLVNDDEKTLQFNVIHNHTLNIHQSGDAIALPDVPLYSKDDSPNLANVSSYAFHTGEIINIKDVYKARRFEFDGTRNFDAALGYRSKSMLVIPMKNHQNDIIGILQLINATDFLSGQTIAFGPDAQEKAAALASQASVILTQQMLIQEMKDLFEAFIRAIAVSIDAKSKHTGGHIQRVTQLSLMIAQQINEDTENFDGITLTPDQIDELRIASLMHDTGKITTPDHIIGKSARLETVHNRIDLIRTRWEMFKTHAKLSATQAKLDLAGQNPDKGQIEKIDIQCKKAIEALDTEFNKLQQINSQKGNLSSEQLSFLSELKDKTVLCQGEHIPCLQSDEYENLCVERGTLTEKERNIINDHAYLTEKILKKLPWPKNLSNIPFIAGAHHEKLDGSGYPLKLTGKDLNIQARILAVADIFEALSAQDRPYKEPMALSLIEKILTGMATKGTIDKDIIQLFFKRNLHKRYAREHLTQTQLDN